MKLVYCFVIINWNFHILKSISTNNGYPKKKNRYPDEQSGAQLSQIV